MRVLIFACILMLPFPAWAQDPSAFVTSWLERCYEHSAQAFEDAADIMQQPHDSLSEGEKRLRSRVLLSRHVCAAGPLTVCAHARDEAACLNAATRWFDARRIAILQEMPKAVPEGSSLAQRPSAQRYKAFVNSGGTKVNGLDDDCPEDQTRLTRIGPVLVTPIQCGAYAAGYRLTWTLRWGDWAKDKAEPQ
ncbi:MAG: hypothetical protein AAFZ99_11940 [Pseudomonadota bacterium]